MLALPGLAPVAVSGNPVFTETVQALLTRVRREGLRPLMKAELTA